MSHLEHGLQSFSFFYSASSPAHTERIHTVYPRIDHHLYFNCQPLMYQNQKYKDIVFLLCILCLKAKLSNQLHKEQVYGEFRKGFYLSSTFTFHSMCLLHHDVFFITEVKLENEGKGKCTATVSVCVLQCNVCILGVFWP